MKLTTVVGRSWQMVSGVTTEAESKTKWGENHERIILEKKYKSTRLHNSIFYTMSH